MKIHTVIIGFVGGDTCTIKIDEKEARRMDSGKSDDAVTLQLTTVYGQRIVVMLAHVTYIMVDNVRDVD